MEFLNIKGEKIDVDIFEESELVDPILARAGGLHAVISSTEDLKTLDDEAGKAILANSPHKFFLNK
ncbi:hypothetical protein A3715_29630 [Oleiphilus sp. HI0009]|nr:hypothetical protein A3715_11350 [Oleiphilus sp. HI0009]KZX84559.1 hypothetical protein A3715_29630 [Oleiphilus sp. HI0009]